MHAKCTMRENAPVLWRALRAPRSWLSVLCSLRSLMFDLSASRLLPTLPCMPHTFWEAQGWGCDAGQAKRPTFYHFLHGSTPRTLSHGFCVFPVAGSLVPHGRWRSVLSHCGTGQALCLWELHIFCTLHPSMPVSTFCMSGLCTCRPIYEAQELSPGLRDVFVSIMRSVLLHALWHIVRHGLCTRAQTLVVAAPLLTCFVV